MAGSGTLSSANLRPRTVALRDPSGIARPSLGDRLSAVGDRIIAIWDRLPSRVRSFAQWLVQPRALLVMGLIATTVGASTIYYYNKLAGEIDARLNNNALDNSLGIFSAPFKVSVGDRLPINDLSEYLRAAGYQQRATGIDEDFGGSYQIDGDALLVFPGNLPSSRTDLNPVRIQFDRNGRVLSLTSPATGDRMSSTVIEGELLASVRDGDRRKKIPVQFSDIPENLRDAIVAAEDRRFFSHSGIDWRGIVRALKTDLDHGEFVQGGSTLTQQIIKTNFLTRERTLGRKLKEAAMAIILESRLTKEQIFTFYCNDVYLGQSGTFAIKGFAQASQVYFDKNLSELTLAQSAFLAGLICAPNRYSAHRDQARAIERRNLVLDAMVRTEAISLEEAEAAKAEELQIKKHETEDDDGTSYFIDYVQRFIDERIGAGGLSSQHRILTTLDARLQHAAYTAVKRQVAKLDKAFARSPRKNSHPAPVQGRSLLSMRIPERCWRWWGAGATTRASSIALATQGVNPALRLSLLCMLPR